MLLGEPRNQSVANHELRAEQEKYWNDSLGTIGAKLQNFTKYVRRVKPYQVPRSQRCFRPAASRPRQRCRYRCRTRSQPLEESASAASEQLYVGNFAVEEHTAADIDRAVRMHDTTRYLGHMPKVELIVGDVEETLPQYPDANPHLVVSLRHRS